MCMWFSLTDPNAEISFGFGIMKFLLQLFQPLIRSVFSCAEAKYKEFPIYM